MNYNQKEMHFFFQKWYLRKYPSLNKYTKVNFIYAINLQ